MDWLYEHYANVLCRQGKVVLSRPGLPKVEFRLSRPTVKGRIVSVLKVQKYMRQGCRAFLVNVFSCESKVTPLEELEVVREFPEVFSDELPGLPPQREVDFHIELVPGTTPISKAPYRMAPVELEKLKK
jgi:hypothetical protein